MSYIEVTLMLIWFVLGIVVGKYVRFLDKQGAENAAIARAAGKITKNAQKSVIFDSEVTAEK